MENLVEYLGKGFMVMLSVSMPCVLMAALVGLVVGILQAVTQVQEQTIAAAPKIVIVFLTIVLLGGYFIKLLTNYFYEGANIAFQIIPKTETFVLPSNYYKYTKPFANEMNDAIPTGRLNKNLINSIGKGFDKTKTKNSIYINSKQTPVVEPNLIEANKIRNNK